MINKTIIIKIYRKTCSFKHLTLILFKKIKNKITIWIYFIFHKTLKSVSKLPEENLILISHYKENLEWVDNIKIPYLIYSKGGSIKQKNYLKLPNIGREGHSYLHFIINHWDNLPKKIIFSQGDPIEHNPNFINILENYKYFNHIQPLTDRWISPKNPKLKWNDTLFENGLPFQYYRNKFSKSIPGGKAYIELLDSNLKTVFPYQFTDKGVMNLKIVERNGPSTLNYLFEKLRFNEKVPKWIAFNYSGIFSVNRELIFIRKKSFYENLLCFLLEDDENGIILERLWLTIFNFEINSWYPNYKNSIKE